jgi:4-amino-4-deoxy-L-arabinose transferase-like glycosyltransferase
VFLGSTLGIYLSGNTEVIQIPLILSSIVLLTIGIENKNNYLLSISGVFASIVVNINYLSGFILAPIFLYVLCSKLCSIGRFFVILSSVLLSIGIIFIPFLISGREKILEYFYMQNHFLHLYSASPKERLHTIQMVIVKISFLYPALIIWFSNKNIFWNNIRERMLTLWFLSSVLATIMSGHSYDHYASLFLIPAMAICAILHRNGQMSSFWLMSPLYVYSFIYMIHSTISNINEIFVVNRINYHEISQIVGKSKVLNIRSDHSLYYLANIETFDRFLFTDHIDIYFGNQADEHYMQDLRQKPKFVLMSYKSCDVFNNDNNICKWINDKYHLIYKAYNYKKPLHIKREYYELYKLNE